MSGKTRRRKKKITKQRGTRRVGRGTTKKGGRGRGSRKGRGSVKSYGGGYRNFMYIAKYEPWRLYRKGFYSHKLAQKGINLKRIGELCKKDGKDSINITDYGYGKVLGGGEISKALEIKALEFSKKALEKIKKVGGTPVIIGQENGEKLDN